jgi:hypothetical protein
MRSEEKHSEVESSKAKLYPNKAWSGLVEHRKAQSCKAKLYPNIADYSTVE